MNEWIRAADFLRSASNAIGQDVNLLSPGDLDGILSKHHTELAQLVADGSEFDVSQEQLEEFIERFGEVGEFVQEAIDQEMFRHFDNSEIRLDKIAEAGRRSFLIRRHMMEAKIEDRERRKWCLH
jgi:Asp-tRNA(Asn)/Glu-tRNA(Gln) amidotransferase C subunit